MASGVVAILGSALLLLLGALGLLGVATMKNMPRNPAAPQADVRFAALVGLATIFVLGLWGIVSGIGLTTYKNWARVSTLIWSGLTAVFGTIAFIATLFVTIPTARTSPPGAAAAGRAMAGVFYLIPVGIAVWWLILFTRKPIAEMFGGAPALLAPGALVDPSGFPAILPKPRAPLAVAIVAWVLLITAALTPLSALLAGRTGVVLFGTMARGPFAICFWVANSVVALGAGIGLLRVRVLGWWLGVASQAFLFVSGLFSLLSPNYANIMHEVMAGGRFSSGASRTPVENLRLYGSFGLVIPVAALAILIYCRAKFVEQTFANRPRPMH